MKDLLLTFACVVQCGVLGVLLCSAIAHRHGLYYQSDPDNFARGIMFLFLGLCHAASLMILRWWGVESKRGEVMTSETPEQTALREKPDETIAQWDDAASATEQLATDGTLRGTCRRLRAALAQLKLLREAAEPFAKAEWYYNNIRPGDWKQGWVLVEDIKRLCAALDAEKP